MSGMRGIEATTLVSSPRLDSTVNIRTVPLYGYKLCIYKIHLLEGLRHRRGHLRFGCAGTGDYLGHLGRLVLNPNMDSLVGLAGHVLR